MRSLPRRGQVECVETDLVIHLESLDDTLVGVQKSSDHLFILHSLSSHEPLV